MAKMQLTSLALVFSLLFLGCFAREELDVKPIVPYYYNRFQVSSQIYPPLPDQGAQPPFPPFRLPHLPWGPAPGGDGTKCWDALREIGSCRREIMRAHFTGKMDHVKEDCCKAFMDAKDDCTSGIFKTPFFHLALQQRCSNQAQPPSKA
ncbi:Egg cell-secreted protein like [Actinidia chinensis var. chinensis]|uniref:Egg cell-secreted protein like n=1 Tax=Actinidia chinensis var. chinensis TaxID=1590841 RepID=A0A2R6PUS8_ACTCC|nr:Egg cell-secreted protein like [Actinidia chinensis var. chinensis]